MTSLGEQLQNLSAPQTVILVESKQRSSIIFDAKEAANKDRKTIYDLGYNGLMELIEMNTVFAQFEETLFDKQTISVERSVESAVANKLIDKNIKKFFCYLSPYFMIQPAHMCLEWLICRYNVHEYNKTDLIGLILPYHETKVFVKCIQILNLKNRNGPWKWLETIQKSGTSISKNSIYNRAAIDPDFLKFVCNITENSMKELGDKAFTLQVQINFYYTVIIGGLEIAKQKIKYILAVLPSVLLGLECRIVDFTSAVLMITVQICTKTQLPRDIINKFVGAISKINIPSMQTDVILSLLILFKKQNQIANDFLQENLIALIAKEWVVKVLSKVSKKLISLSPILVPLFKSCLNVFQTRMQGWTECKNFLEALLVEVTLKNKDIKNLISSVLDSYSEIEFSRERISSDDVVQVDLENKDSLIGWYSQYLKSIEIQYPVEFDNMIKKVMLEDNEFSKSRKMSLNKILAFRLKKSYFENNTIIYESLYNYNTHNRREGVRFFVESFQSINASDINKDLLKGSLKNILNDEAAEVVDGVLKLSSEYLVDAIGNEELIRHLFEILLKCQVFNDWKELIPISLKHLTNRKVYENTDLNRIFLSIFPFLLPTSDSELNNTRVLFVSDFVQELPILRAIITKINKISDYRDVCKGVFGYLRNTKPLLKLTEFLESFKGITDNFFMRAFNFPFFLLIIDYSYFDNTDPSVGLQIIKFLFKFENKLKLLSIDDENEWFITMKKNKVPLNIFLELLTTIIKQTNFGNLQNFDVDSKSFQLYIAIFEFLIKNALEKNESEQRKPYSHALGVILQECFKTLEEKIMFLSNFLTCDRNANTTISYELQLRSMKLFCLVANGNDQNYKIDEIVFAKILITLSSEIPVIRKYGLNTLKTIKNSKRLESSWKNLILQILQYSADIEIHNEHLPLIMSIIFSTEINTLNLILNLVIKSDVDVYLKGELLALIKHINNMQILKKVVCVGLKILKLYQGIFESKILNLHEAKIIELISLRFNQKTIKLLANEPALWEFIKECLRLHKVILNKDGKITSVASLIVDIFDEFIYHEMPEEFKELFLELLVNAVTFNDIDNMLAFKVRNFIKRIDIDCKYIISILDKMKNICDNSPVKIKGKNISPDFQLLSSSEWKNGITLLEFLQNKKKMNNQNILISVLFDILKNCIIYDDQFSLEYPKQLILSCLLLFCQKHLNTSIKSNELSESFFQIDTIVQCIRRTQNPQTHHHALLLLSICASIVPQQVLHNMMSIFTFMGSSIIRQDDSFSFQIISNIIESIIPILVQARKQNKQQFNDEIVIPILKVFVDVILDVPEHRRVLLYSTLIRVIDPSKYLWIFLCILFESHVIHEKKNRGSRQSIHFEMSELPKRIEIALQIAKEFDSVIAIKTLTSLFTYLKSLLADKCKENNMEIDITDSELFNSKTHSDKHFRHYKYVILQFITSYLTSTDFLNQTAVFSDKEIVTMKHYYQNFITQILSYIPDVVISEKRAKDVQKQFWKVILHHCYDALDSAISLLSPDMLLSVVCRLMQQSLLIIRKKIIDILIHKLQSKTDFLENCKKDNILKLLEILSDICDSISYQQKRIENATCNEVIHIQQVALMAIKVSSKLVGLKYSNNFKEILIKLIKILKNHRFIPKVYVASLVLTVTEIVSNLRAQSIVFLPKFMPLLIEILQDQSKILKIQSPDSISNAIVTGMQKIFEVLPLFLGPYLTEILTNLIKIWVKCSQYQQEETKRNVILSKLVGIQVEIASIIPLRILIPNFVKVYSILLEEKEYNGVEYLLSLLKESFESSSSNDIEAMQFEITSFFLSVLEFRSKFSNIVDIAIIEESIVQAFVALTLKLSENSFRPVYCKIYDWATRKSSLEDNSITFFLLSSRISEALQSLFVLFLNNDFIQQASKLLDKCNTTKSNTLYFSRSIDKNNLLLKYIFQTLNNVFLYDNKNFINSYLFDVIMQPIVDQLQNLLIISNKSLQLLLLSTLSQLAVTIKNDTLLKQLNYQILLKTRSNQPNVRVLAFTCCINIARKIGQDFSSFLPESMPFIAELLEDDNENVEKACKAGLRELEKILGESLQKYF